MAKPRSVHSTGTNIERAVFTRVPIRVNLPVGRERMITLPGVAALHVPDDIETVAKIQSIDRTVYVTALAAFTPIRVVAELLDGGQQIPLDLQAGPESASATSELEVFLPTVNAGDSNQAVADSAASTASASSDMVELTRFAARMLYAPKRLALPRENITQVPLTLRPHLLGAWRRGWCSNAGSPWGQVVGCH